MKKTIYVMAIVSMLLMSFVSASLFGGSKVIMINKETGSTGNNWTTDQNDELNTTGTPNFAGADIAGLLETGSLMTGGVATIDGQLTTKSNLRIEDAGNPLVIDYFTDGLLMTYDYITLSTPLTSLWTFDLFNKQLELPSGGEYCIGTTCFGTSDISNWNSDDDTTLSDEEVEDYVGSMVTGNTESGITVTYQDTDGTLDFVVSATGGSPSVEQFEGSSSRNFIQNACFNVGDGSVSGTNGWNPNNALNVQTSSIVRSGVIMNVTEDVDISSWHQTNNPYMWVKVNSTNWSSIDYDNDITGRFIQFEGNENPANTNLSYEVADVNSTHIKLYLPYGMTIPTYATAPTWGEPVTTSERLEVVDIASRCNNAFKIYNRSAMYTEWIEVPAKGQFLLDAEVMVPKFIRRSGDSYARVIVQIEAADANDNVIYRFRSEDGPDFKAGMTDSSAQSGNYNWYGDIGSEGWQRVQYQLPDLSDVLNWVAASNGLGSYDAAGKTPTIKLRLRVLNQYNEGNLYITGAQLIQGTSAKSFDLALLGENNGGFTGTCASGTTLTVEYGLITGCS